MPGKIKVKVLAGRNLPVMDRASDTTDAFVEIKFGNVTHKTDVCRKTLNPHWNSTEWYRFEVDESELQDEPLQLRLMDHDTYSANDAIGKVVISLAPLLAREANNAKGAGPPGAVLSGWIPVFDTMHGIRGELNVIVKVELFSDFNKYKTSSCGVQFFHSASIPPGYRTTAIHGFVEELVVNDDPEYQWIDKIRTPRASNEARQVAFIKLSNQVQRLVGLKAAELGANAVVGYQQDFDLEGEAGVVARAIGTAVSLIPPPVSSQSLSIPPCTQQQLRKYLDILAVDNESITDLNEYFQSHREELQKLLNIMNPKTPLLDDPENIEEDEKCVFTRQSSIKSYTAWYQDDYVSHNSLKHITEDQTELNKLLKRNEDLDSDPTGTLQKIKKLKSNFTRRLGSLRSRRADKQDDSISLQSTSSDNSRISLTDIKNEFKKFKRLKKPKIRKAFINNEDEGIGMASILARSVIHAHTSLACIAEKEAEHSPSSTIRCTSESEPTINVSDDERKSGKANSIIENKHLMPNVPQIHTSLNNVNIDSTDTVSRQRKLSESCPTTPMVERSENLLKLPCETGYYGSLSLSGDSSVYSSSEEDDDDSSDQNADADKSVETTSSVVQSVLKNDVNPVLIAHVERKLSILEGAVPDLKESKSHGIFANNQELEKNIETSKSSPCINEKEDQKGTNFESDNISQQSFLISKDTNEDKSIPAAQKPYSNLHFKFQNPFAHKKVSKSMSAPSSPVENKSFMYRSSKRIKRQLSKISKSNMFKSFSHYSLTTKKKDQPINKPLSQPGSTPDVPSKVPSHETVLGSPFLSYADLMSLDKDKSESRKKSLKANTEIEHPKVTMYIGSEPVSRASLSGLSSPHYRDDSYSFEQTSRKEKVLKPTGLVHQALETVLIDKVESLLLPSQKTNQTKEQRFFNDVNRKLGKIEEDRNQHRRNKDMKFGSCDNRDDLSLPTVSNSSGNFLSLPATPAVLHGTNNQFFDDHHNLCRRSGSKERKTNQLVHKAMKTILIDRIQTLLPPETEPVIVISDKRRDNTKESDETSSTKHREKKHSLIHTAMETILIDKVKELLPPSTEPIETDEEYLDDNEKYKKTECINLKDDETKRSSTFSTAMEPMLLEKAQALIPISSEPINHDCISRNTIVSNMSQIPDKIVEVKDSHSGLLQTAMETMLLDKVQSLIPTYSEPVPFDDTCRSEVISDIMSKSPNIGFEGNGNNSDLFHTAVETMLMDKVQILIPSTCEPVSMDDSSRKNESNTSEITFNIKNTKDHDSNLFNTAMETILMDKIQSLIPSSSELPISKINPLAVSSVRTQVSNEFKDKNFGCRVKESVLNNVEPIIPNSQLNLKEIKRDSEDVTPHIANHKYDCKGGSGDILEILNAYDIKEQKLVKQDSIHSLQEEPRMSKEIGTNLTVSSRVTHSRPVLQHFHPILSGPPLETIPSLPEASSLDHSESLDVDGVERTCNCQTECHCKECDNETNNASVCGNSHAACDVDRNEREKETCEKDKEIEKERDKSSPRHARHESYGGREPVVASQSVQNSSFTPSMPLGIQRRSSDSDLSVTPKGGSLNASIGNTGSGGGAILRPSMNSSNIEMLEYPFLTMTEYPPGLIVHIGGTVCARSVKLVDPGGESAARAAWWAELRTELRAHARALRCNAVIAYTENAAICEDVCVLSASGTAVVINLDCDYSNELETASVLLSHDEIPEPEDCTLAHVPYSPGAGPYRAELSTCGGCRRARVPAVLLATCAKPPRLPAYLKAVTITAVAARIRRAPPASEPGARDISDQLPFLEYELHKLLLAKLRMQGANALFSLKTQISIGERCVMALASGTAVRLSSLPPPTPPRIKASENDKNALEIQRALWDSFTANKASNGYDIGGSADHIPNGTFPEPEFEDAPALDLCSDKDACVLELDEAEDVETAKTLAARRTLMPVFTSHSKAEKGAPPQMFAQVWRARLSITSTGGGGASTAAERHVARALDGVIYKLRRLQPCALVAPRFQLELPEDEIQIIVSGSAIPLIDPNNPERNVPEMTYNFNNNSNNSSPEQFQNSNSNSQGNIALSDNEDDNIFTLDEEQFVKKEQHPTEPIEDKSLILNPQVPTSVSLTTLGFVSGSRAERRICALRLLFVRETTAVRELGGLSGFLHTFTCEVLAIVRAYTAALGGNALTSFYLTQLMLQDNAHKNQGQCLLSVGGDVVFITY